MTMYVAMNSQQQLVAIQEVERGLACDCTCIECGEALIARKGEQNEHHFAHSSSKESCEVRRESLLHLFAKQVIREAMGLQMPHLPGQPPEFGDPSSWWDFEQVEEESHDVCRDAGDALPLEPRLPEHRHPSQNRVERRAQFV